MFDSYRPPVTPEAMNVAHVRVESATRWHSVVPVRDYRRVVP
jgi:hypothetical protein